MNLQERARRIITQPKLEWPVIEAEATDVATLYKSYILPLAAIPAIAMFIGLVVFGGRWIGVTYALRAALFQYIGQLVGVYVSAFIVAKLAPQFASRDDQVQALKLIAYSSTPVWVAGVLYIIPPLGLLVIVAALYSIYVCYLGVPVLMKTPQDKVIPYLVVSVLVIIVVMFVLSFILGAIGGAASVTSGVM
ncbi:MAG TPA: Yip1 family protein [Vicinamibacterales bacterium]|nr:Yip1 family protein [Vicinamibacterales bacterium]